MSLLLRMVVSFTFKGVLVFLLLNFGRRLRALLFSFLGMFVETDRGLGAWRILCY